MKLQPTQLALAIGSAILLTLAGCGGGGGGGAAAVASTSAVTVSPSLGKFSAGAKIIVKSLSGVVVGTGTTDSTGTATVNIGSYSGPMIIEVTGGPGVTYFDENTGSANAFGSTDTLSAIAPSVQGTIGVTAATNAAAEALKSNNGGSISTAISAADISLANSRIASALGITDVLQAPSLVDSSTSATLDLANVKDKYALQLAALAKLASTGKTALDVANDLANDLKDNKLDGTFTPLSGTGTPVPNTSTAYTAGTITGAIAVNLVSAATSYGTTDTKNLITADASIVGTVTPDVTTVVAPPAGTNTVDLQKVKAFFAELRTTFRSLSNGTKTGFLDNQATRASTDLNATVGPDMDKVLRRLDTVGLAIRSYEGAQPGAVNTNGLLAGTTNVTTNGVVTPTATLSIQNGNFANVWYGTGGYQYCYTATPASSTSVVTCLAAGFDSADYVNSLIKFIRFDLTPVAGMPGSFTYTALRYNRPVTSVNGNAITLGTSVGANGACLATHATGGVNDGTCNGTISKGATAFTLMGTFPPSTPTTGIDTVALLAAKTALTATTSRYALSGTFATADSATSINTASLSLDSGTQIDVDETNAATTGPRPIAFTIKGTVQSKATKFVGTVTASAFGNDASGNNYSASNVVFNGAISDTSIGGAGEILTGKLEAAATNWASYNSALPLSPSNFLRGTVTFTGTVQAPGRPLAKLVVSGSHTGFDTDTATVNYTYGTVSISGSGTVVGTVTTSTVSNQDGVQFAPDAGKTKTLVTKSGNTLAEIQNGTIRYVDGFTESAL